VIPIPFVNRIKHLLRESSWQSFSFPFTNALLLIVYNVLAGPGVVVRNALIIRDQLIPLSFVGQTVAKAWREAGTHHMIRNMDPFCGIRVHQISPIYRV
jgi:hypothetical protein